MDERLKERPHTCDYEALAYEHGTHFVLPESLLRIALPVGLKFILRFIFKAAKEYPDECEATRKDIDTRLSIALAEWIKQVQTYKFQFTALYARNPGQRS